MPTTDVTAAAAALHAGDLVVYPTETVYGLGADALDAEAVEAVFAAKGRSREKPVSMAVESADAATAYTDPDERARALMAEFLPGPVTVVVERREMVPDVLTAGRDRVGVRVPDHDLALSLLSETAVPVTATSANVSGQPSATTLADIDTRVRDAAAVLLDGGDTPGGGSTVVEPATGEIHRRGPLADDIEAWLAAH